MSIVICNICGKQHKGNFETCVSCTTKEQQMSIEIGSKWIKDGEVIEVSNIVRTPCAKGTVISIDTIIYHTQLEDFRARERADFLEQYKPYEVVYEYQYAYMDTDNCAETTSMFYKDDVEFLEAFKDNFNKYFQRLDFTKQRRQ